MLLTFTLLFGEIHVNLNIICGAESQNGELYIQNSGSHIRFIQYESVFQECFSTKLPLKHILIKTKTKVKDCINDIPLVPIHKKY